MKVQDILTSESKWTKGAYARTATGKRTIYQSDDACKFCLQGAIYRVTAGNVKRAMSIENKIVKKLNAERQTCSSPYWCITQWNDSSRRTFAEVRGLIEELDI